MQNHHPEVSPLPSPYESLRFRSRPKPKGFAWARLPFGLTSFAVGAVWFFPSSASAGAISGRIVDNAGKPVVGAAVALEKSKASMVTDAQGRFSFTTVSLFRENRGKSHSVSQAKGDPSTFHPRFQEGREEITLATGSADMEGRRLPGTDLGMAEANTRFAYGTAMYSRNADAPVVIGLKRSARGTSGTSSDTAPGGPARIAAWDDTLAVSKTGYLSKRLVPTSGEADLGDIALYGTFPGASVNYLGFAQYNFTVAGKSCLVVVPKQPAVGNPWIWRTYFWDHKHHFDSLMCARGYYLAFMDVPNLYGAPQAVMSMDSFYLDLTAKYGLSRKTNLVGISRGAFYAYNWGRDNIAKISTLYGDGAGMDYVSWPCGCYGTGAGSPGDWTALKNVFGFPSDAVAKAYQGNPYQNMKPFALAKIPIIHVYGEADDVAPPKENVLRANDSLKAYGWQMKLLPKPNTGHVHGLDASDGGLPGQLDTLVNFVVRNTSF